MQDPTALHQTDIESIVHQDDLGTVPPDVSAPAPPPATNGRTNGNGSTNGSGNTIGNSKAASAVVKTRANGSENGANLPDSGKRGRRLNNAPGLTMTRRYTTPGQNVYDTVEWEQRDAVISNERGEKVFEQTGVEIPKTWTQLATNVVVSKYFRGHIGTPQRERSVRQLIGRVADTIAVWGREMEYFATENDAQAFQDELTYILLHQKAAFNSPVWFNVGLADQPQPQASACQPYDALVSTPQGLIPIGRLVEENAVGTVVFDAHGTTRIVATKANGRKTVLRVHTRSGYTLDVTPDHLVWKQSGGGTHGKWVEAGSLEPSDRLVWKRTPLTGKAGDGGREEAEAALAGWLQSDGFVGQYETGTNRSLTVEAITVNADEEAWVRAAFETVLPGVHTHNRDVATQDTALTCRRHRAYGECLRPFVTKWDLQTRAQAMQVPAHLYSAPYPVVAAYLRSVFQAEGYVTVRENAAIRLDMIAEPLIRGVQRLLLRFGIYARVRFKNDARTDRKGCWSLTIRTLGDRRRFADEIGFVGETKQNKLLASLLLKGLEATDCKTLHVERVETLGEMDVYDIQTESGEYLSGNLRVHNCFINGVEDTMESILTLAKTEGMLFKFGSGTGTNLSTIRGSSEKLRGGGTASGPLSFMRGFDQFAGAIKCLTPDAYVHTEQGMQTLGETIDPNLTPGFHADQSVVLATKDGPTRISHVYVSPEAPTRRLTLRHTGLTLRGTHEHPVLTLTPDFALVWKTLGGLAVGDRVAVSRRTEMWPARSPDLADFAPVARHQKKALMYPTSLTPELARLLGYMISEGSMDAARFRFCNADRDVFDDFLACVQLVFGVDDVSRNIAQRTHPKTGVTTWLFEACWTNAVRFLQHAGLTLARSDAKTVPSSIRRAPRALVVEFLRAYFEGDGHVSTHVYASSASEALLREVQLLLLNMGMVPALRPHIVNDKTYWNLILRGEQAWLFVRDIGFVSARKQNAAQLTGDKHTNVDTVPFLADLLRTRVQGVRYLRCDDGVNRSLNFGFFNRLPGSSLSYNLLRNAPGLIDKVRTVNPAWASTLETVLEREFFWDTASHIEEAAPAVTYDFTVPETHSFIANGIVNHNSGGKTRRAAKMNLLDVSHPDIEAFITSKADEEKKAWALIDAGYSGAFNVPGGAYDSVLFQNANNSVRVTDEFMQVWEQDGEWTTHNVLGGQPSRTYKARDLMQKIGESAWICGDPGMQYDTTINKWHTCKNTDRIYASNPCCITGETLIAVADGRNAVPIRDLIGTEVPIYAHDHATGRTTVSRMWNIGVKRQNAPIYRVTLDDGSTFRATDDHLIMQRDGSYRMVRDLKAGDSLMPFHSKVLAPAQNRTRRRFYWSGQSWQPQYRAVWQWANGTQPSGYHIHHRDFDALNDTLTNLELLPESVHNALHSDRMRGDNNPARRAMTAEWRQHIADAMRGEKNGHYGKTHSDTARQTMRDKAAQRWADDTERQRSGERVREALAKVKAEGRAIGRPQGERFERCCPICRSNFATAREAQIFCSGECRYSPMGRQMTGAKTADRNRGRALSPEHKAKLRLTSLATANPEAKRGAANIAHHNTILKAARLLLDNDITPTLDNWDVLRQQALGLGATRFPTAATVARHFADETTLQEEALLYNHKVVSIEADGCEDVFDGTVDTHHNFAILTSDTSSCVEGMRNYSGIFIHNSEFVFLNDTACNLASLNLMKFTDENRDLDVESFQHACRVLITAQEILVGNASYPTPRIAENSHDYRPLGLGYANLGALLMARGLAYDSDAGRTYAGAITALMTGEAYHQSAIIARDHGWPFPGYQKNREPFLEVMQMHRDAVEDIDGSLIPDAMHQAARQCWDDAIAVGKDSGYRNAQATVLAPTGTIGFLMDCDTTGIEPDIAIVKYKSLVGGGMMKIVNNTVPEALRRLGYDDAQATAILAYIDEHDTIEGAPGLKDEHLPVFDCAFKPGNGVRTIHHMGHVKMMAAAQPFLSGAISKCVTGETLILTEAGIRPIGSFYEGQKPGNFELCDLALASIAAPQKADLFYYGGVRPTIKLTLADGRTIEGTPNHRVKVANADGYDWKRLDAITPDDHVAVRLGAEMWAQHDAAFRFTPTPAYGNQKPIRTPEWMSPALARFMGYYIAEGNMTRTNWMVRITNNNPTVLQNCQTIVSDLFGISGRIETDARNGVTSYMVASKTLVEFLTYAGCSGDSSEKQIPWAVLQSRRETVQAFVGSLWLDGYVRQDGMVAICLNTPELLRQLQVVLNNFGLRAQLIRKYNKPYDKYFHELGLHGSDARRFAELFPLDDAHKAERLAELTLRTKKVNAVHSDIVPCYREQVQVAVRQGDGPGSRWRHVLDSRTRNLTWQTIQGIQAEYRLPELAEIVDNNIHFVGVRTIEDGFAPVFDFQVPTNHAFLGNGIVNHNTVNMPHEATPDEIADVYVEGWKMGLKAIAIYRDGSKRTQPLSTKRADDGKAKADALTAMPVEAPAAPTAQALPVPAPTPTAPPLPVETAVPQPVIVNKPLRHKLPDERAAITHKFSIAGHEGYITVGMYEDGQPGEIFLTMSKEGSTISGLMDSFATAISLALQYGVPLQTLVDKFAHSRYEPSGYTNNPEIRIAKSITDYIFRYLGSKFLQKLPEDTQPTITASSAARELDGDAGMAGSGSPSMVNFNTAGNGTQLNGSPQKGTNGSGAKGMVNLAQSPNRPRLTLTALAPEVHSQALAAQEHATFQNQADAPICTECGSLMVRNGACYKCLNCGSVFGCS